ncbi:MAG: hypothetical protein DBX47_00710 [Clostridiales bacterium]|nr:MAG: hypothetical protein DBX47_00710 [Clostridiales bacterium]
MATWMTHFRIADRFIDIIGEKNIELPYFIFGNIGPDCGVVNPDGLTYTPDKTVSHFGRYPNREYDRFIKTYLCKKSDAESYSFYLGYYLHLMTDEEWLKNVFMPIKEKYIKIFTDFKSFVLSMRTCWNELDKRFIIDNPEFRAFNIFSDIKNFPNEYIDFFPADAFDRQLNFIRDFYTLPHNKYEQVYEYTTAKELDLFIDRAVKNIENRINDVLK